MSNLRIFGILIGLFGLYLSFRMFRGRREKRYNFLFLLLFNVTLLSISINPSLVNIIEGMLNMEETERGRIIALMICSNIFLWFIIIYFQGSIVKQRIQFDQLIRSISLEKSPKIVKKLTNTDIVVLIPAYNESRNLRELAKKFPEKILGKKLMVLVVDDGSDDDTYSIARENGFVCVKNPINRGGGAALRLGYDILKQGGVDICVTMDADGQHDPKEIITLVEPLIEDRSDIVIGSRIIGNREKDNPLRLAGVYFFSFIINHLLATRITDPSSGFRAFKLNIFDSIQLLEDQYHTSELIIIASKKGLRIIEVPITILKRKHGMSKKGKDWIYAFHFAKTIIKSWWR